jgi:hypothetical protein
VTRFPEGFSHFVTSMTAPVASGWSNCRVGFAPTAKAPPCHGARQKRTFANPLRDDRGAVLEVESIHRVCSLPVSRITRTNRHARPAGFVECRSSPEEVSQTEQQRQ